MATIDLNLLPLFVAVAQTGSFSEAARKLCVPKSSVSRGIASLEDNVGARLLHRTTRHVSLSTAGHAFYERIAPMLATLQQGLGEVAERDEQPAGLVRVTAAVDVGSSLVAEVATRFCTRFPAVELDLRLSNNVVDLVAEGFDMGVRVVSKPLKDSSLSARKVGAITAQLYAAPSYLARRGQPRAPEDLAAHETVMFRNQGSVTLKTASGSARRVKLHGRLRGDEMYFVRAATRAGAGIGLLPTFIAEPEVESGALVRVLSRYTVTAGELWLVMPSAHQVPRKVSALRDFMLDALKPKLT